MEYDTHDAEGLMESQLRENIIFRPPIAGEHIDDEDRRVIVKVSHPVLKVIGSVSLRGVVDENDDTIDHVLIRASGCKECISMGRIDGRRESLSDVGY